MHSISRAYPVNAQTLWQDILDPKALAASMQGSLTYVGLPKEPVVEGQRITVTIRRRGWFPMGDTKARHTDHLDLDADTFTDALFPMFSAMYEQRHEQRLKRLRASAWRTRVFGMAAHVRREITSGPRPPNARRQQFRTRISRGKP